MQFIWIFILLNKNVPRHSMLKQALSTASLNRSSTSSRSQAKKHSALQESLLLRRGPAELRNILGIKKYQTAWVVSRGMTLRYCGMLWLALFGGGGGISSESAGCLRDCIWAHRSRNSKRISFVTGCWMLLHTAVRTTGHRWEQQTHHGSSACLKQSRQASGVVNLFKASYRPYAPEKRERRHL